MRLRLLLAEMLERQELRFPHHLLHPCEFRHHTVPDLVRDERERIWCVEDMMQFILAQPIQVPYQRIDLVLQALPLNRVSRNGSLHTSQQFPPQHIELRPDAHQLRHSLRNCPAMWIIGRETRNGELVDVEYIDICAN